MDRQIDKCKDRWMDKQIDKWIHRQLDIPGGSCYQVNPDPSWTDCLDPVRVPGTGLSTCHL